MKSCLLCDKEFKRSEDFRELILLKTKEKNLKQSATSTVLNVLKIRKRRNVKIVNTGGKKEIKFNMKLCIDTTKR